MEVHPAVARDLERGRGDEVPVGDHGRGIRGEIAQLLQHVGIAQARRGEHRHTGLEGECLHGRGGELPAAPGGGIGAREHGDDVVARVEQGTQGGKGGFGGAGEDKTHDEVSLRSLQQLTQGPA